MSFRFGMLEDGESQLLWGDGELALCRMWCRQHSGARVALLAVGPTAEHPTPASLERLAHEHSLRDELDCAWAARPLELVRERGRTLLLLEDTGGEPLVRLLAAPLPVERFLRLAIAIVAALGKVHQRGLVHKDLKPSNVLVSANGEARLTGFGIASRLPRERQAPEPPETIAGTLAYMAPEQTGRMNRSIDARSDLYALGVVFYQMLTGSLPFAADDPIEWVHCHIARKPVPPHERIAGMPRALSSIVMKLLAKTVEERYQTAGGVERDLRRCLAQWEVRHSIEPFAPGEFDTPDRLVIPEKLYGRAHEIDVLLGAFHRVVDGGAPELVLVTGYSGIGKSSVVNELHKVLVPPRGLFASGKFDQYRRDIPYSTLAQAFQGLVRPLLVKSDAELAEWREALCDALGPNAQLMIDVVPELELIIGEQPPVPEIAPQDAQRRFQLAFRRFVGVFARPEHPLALFLDDLQWLDAATLDWLDDLLTRSDLRHLLLIGAYRDNEVDAGHPLRRKLDAIRHAGAKIDELKLAPLAREHLSQLVADALRCEPQCADPLAHLVHTKTAGNPFFARQFIAELADEGLLRFAHDVSRWRWDLDSIDAKGYTDNVVDLMVGKLVRLPLRTRTAMQQLACIGNAADIRLLAVALGSTEERVHADLSDALRLELVERLSGVYRFAHDRVQEAAYLLIPEASRAAAHLQIGRMLAAHTPPARRDDAIFEIVNQLNQGAPLITTDEERERVASLDLMAGKRAKASSAYVSALSYFAAGRALLPAQSGETHYELVFALDLQRAECELITGDAAAEASLSLLATRANNLTDLAAVASLREILYTMRNQFDESVQVASDYMRSVGAPWPSAVTWQDVLAEYDAMRKRLDAQPFDRLAALPPMSDPAAKAIVEVLTEIVPAAYFTDMNLCCLVVCRIANLSFQHGNSNGSVYAYSLLGFFLRTLFGDHDVAFGFGKLALELATRPGLSRFKARCFNNFAYSINPWTNHIRSGRELLQQALNAAEEAGDLSFAAYIHFSLMTDLIASGDPLDQVHEEGKRGFDYASKTRFGLIVDVMTGHLLFIRTMRGLTPRFGTFDDAQFDEARFEQHLEATPGLANPSCIYWIRKLQARFFAGDDAAAVAAASKAAPLLWTSPASFEQAEYHFYAALAHAASCDFSSARERRGEMEAIAGHYGLIARWAEKCPANLENRAALIAAEIARIEGRESDAMHLYERAIRSSREYGFVQNEALANELAARFYLARGFDRIGRAYLRDARYGYFRWGADGKVRQLDESYPELAGEAAHGVAAAATIGAPVDYLDLATVIKVSQAVSGEIVLEKMLDVLMRSAIEQAGAERGLLVVLHGSEARIAAEASVGEHAVVVEIGDGVAHASDLPQSVLHYALHSRDCVILDDASAENFFSADPYIRERQSRSILCLPLLARAKLIGVLYLENHLAPRVFAPARVAVLKLLASQSAIALENARLYADLAEREGKIRRLVDANIVGIVIFALEGVILEANDAFLRIVRYDRDDLVSGRLSWMDLTPPDWLERDRRLWVPMLRATGMLQPIEKEYLRKDGSRVPVLIGVAMFEEDGSRGVAFVLDLSERRQAEQNAREMQRELEHANRVTTMGQLAASISHEIKQPIASAATNASAGLRWLDRVPPELGEVREVLERIIQDAMRASDVMNRIHGLVRNAPTYRETLRINDTIREVVALTRGEAEKDGVCVVLRLAEGLPLVTADRVQLQQVMMNLIVNAIEAMSAVDVRRRELTISTCNDEPRAVRVAVSDSGPGVPSANTGRLFAPFYTTKASGLGMGLSICRSIIEAHGGTLGVSANVPQGAVFEFSVPVSAAAAEDGDLTN
ncbi:AAA family ATPase [Paraburkholderia sp. SARCC-3016]|uniref:trifunctional serine/threonine-protein kinase/ATP-binding protein/sensor histidine kinase n=1 Tax=Paraburkholderia sp. SARCC-3016 TaxID=3058611 RepID=UPI00280844C1|nr:AAA family ATPase [Paraburkholderia sp. SARCC-3016]MDQ7977284.1 AAA family ATPase [Paraburkholderia sp. SARCC-3016]